MRGDKQSNCELFLCSQWFSNGMNQTSNLHRGTSDNVWIDHKMHKFGPQTALFGHFPNKCVTDRFR